MKKDGSRYVLRIPDRCIMELSPGVRHEFQAFKDGEELAAIFGGNIEVYLVGYGKIGEVSARRNS